MLQLRLSYALNLKMAVFDRLFQTIHHYGLATFPIQWVTSHLTKLHCCPVLMDINLVTLLIFSL